MNRRDLLTTLTATVGAVALASSTPNPVEAAPEDAGSAWYERGWKNGHTAGYHEGWDIGERTGQRRATQEAAPAAVVAGALYDFMGWLTTRDEPITVSRSHTVYAVMDSFQAWAKERGLDIDTADVRGWQGRLS